ncbi:WecB/TagA/CpsF family glycosyltransferase [Caenimonas terrae]|uniref:WecB/TagA/CpsF family glycosyltransferase n=1 Tax=Caenimonas terrae TaxID=696074 RepID=A0ABW0NGX2_9BURK
MTNILPKAEVLGVPVNALGFSQAQDRVLTWGGARQSRYVVLANVHVVVTAARDPSFGAVVAAADLIAPDGAPVAWMLRRLGYAGQERVSGPDLTLALLARCAVEGLSVYFFGSTRQTLVLLVERITAAFPALNIVGFEAPSFGVSTPQEDAESVERINASGAGLVFVGLGCPKQEHWMLAHRGRVNAVMLGVGAAFDFHAGTVSRAPLWMREHGLEWLHRLASEPRRLWRRYFVTNTLFVAGAVRQLLAAQWAKIWQ